MSKQDKEYDKKTRGRRGAHFAKAEAALLPAEETTEVSANKPGGLHPALKVMFIILGALLALYLAGAIAFSFVMMPNTKVWGSDVSLRTATSIAREEAERYAGYKLSVTGFGLDLTVDADQIGLGSNTDVLARAITNSSSPFMWPVRIFTGNDINLTSISYDGTSLLAVVNAAVDQHNESATPPTDASVSFDEASVAYVVNPSSPGTTLDADAVSALVDIAIGRNAQKLELDESVLVQPTVLTDDPSLAETASRANQLIQATQTLVVSGETVAEVGSQQIASWVSMAEDGTVSLNGDAITSWAKKDLSSKLDTVGTTRTYTRPDGKNVSVSGGTYGWNVNSAELAATIADNIVSGTATTIEVPWYQEANNHTAGSPDWGTRYIDVDLSEQYARMYGDDGNVIWESSFVSGDTVTDHATPVGVYSVNSYKGTDQTLIGLDEDKDGEPDYISHVDYWVPFIGNLVAFHDASWRSAFGGTIYQGDGSHGCINLPASKAAELYQITKIGDVVVVHS